MTKTLGVIGSGRIGGTLARLAIDSGWSVVLSNSRGAETLSSLVGELGSNSRAATPAEAAEAGDLVVVSVPVRAMRDLPVAALATKTVIDTINYDPKLHGQVPDVDIALKAIDGPRSTSELLQADLAHSKVVKACNNIFFQTLAILPRPAGAHDRTALPIAGDDPQATAQVSSFLNGIGYDVVDAGPLEEGWRWQPSTPAHLVYAGETIRDAAPAGADRVRAALASARR